MKTFAAAVAVVVTAGLAAPALAQSQAPGNQTIWQIVEASPDHNVLGFAIKTAGLDTVLNAPGARFTLFAPTDQAFELVADELFAAGVGDGTVGTLATFLVTNGLLDDVLLYHVTEGRRLSQSIVPRKGQKPVATLLGAALAAKPGAFLMDASTATSDAAVVAPNLSASNGVVHVIDNVLVPLQ